MTLSPGTRLGPYEIVSPLGAGGMGEVYRARDTRLSRDVAVKVLPEEFARDPERLRRFESEARAASAVSDPHIVTVLDIGSVGGMSYIAEELVDGADLRAFSGNRVPLRKVLDIAAQIAEGLSAAHERGIVHRDLKPENVLVTKGGLAKIADFGLARLGEGSGQNASQMITAEAERTATGTVMGTVAYMSPEQARGERADFRSDQFSFGIILAELLTGRHPFRRATAPETLTAILRDEPPPLGEAGVALPSGLARIVSRCLEKDPGERYGSTRDLARDLRELEPSGPRSSVSGQSARRRRPWAVPIAAALGVAAGAGTAIWLARPAPIAPIRIHALTYSGADSEPVASPDGRLIAFTSWRDGVPRIWIKQVVGGGEAPLTAGPDRLARFSPDGSSLLFVRDLGTTQAIYRTGLIGGEPRRLVDNATEADWSPDGRRVVFVRSRAGGRAVAQIGTLDLATGQEKILADLTNLGNLLLHSPRWSPDGRKIAFASGTYSSADWKLRLLDVATGRVSAVPPAQPQSAMGGIAWSGAGGSLFYVQSSNIMGDTAGSGSEVIRCDFPGGDRRTLFWRDGLSWLNASVSEISQLDVLAPGRLLLAQRLRSQNLREVDLAAARVPSASRLLATGSSIDRQPTYSPDGSQIFFSSNRGGNLDLWTIDRRTRVLRQITDDPSEDWDPAYMPGGRQIVWSSSRGSGHLEIWLANADGSGARRVSSDGVSAQNPEPTPDGKWIVYWSGNPEKLGVWKVHPDGTGTALLVRSADPALSGISPDGRYAFWLEQDRVNLRNTLRVVEVDSGRVVPFEIEVRYTLGAPAVIWGRARWSSGGRSIFFLGENGRGLSGVYEQRFDPDLDTTATRRPVAGFSPEYVTESFGVSPDGSQLALSTGRESASIMVAEGVPGAAPVALRTP